MSESVAIVDYEIGNILIVRRATEHVEEEVALAADAAEHAQAGFLALLDVGAFRDDMEALVREGAPEAVVAPCRSGRTAARHLSQRVDANLDER